jgi:hypothetical protein
MADPHVVADPAPEQPKKKRRPLLLILVGIVGLFVLCGIIASLGGDDDDETTQASAPTSAPTVAQVAAAPTSAPTAAPAPTTAPEPTAAPTAAPAPTAVPAGMPGVGERVEAGGIALTVTEVDTWAGSDFIKPDAGKIYLTANVMVENVSRDTAPYNPMYFAVKDADAYEYDASLFGPDPSLTSGELPKGDKVRGWVAFEVPEKATGFVLSYEPLVILGGYETIRIDLEK